MSTMVHPGQPIQVEGAEGATNMMQLITLRIGLAFEIKHPDMKFTRIPCLRVAQRVTGCKRSKKAAWEAVNYVIVQAGGEDHSDKRPW